MENLYMRILTVILAAGVFAACATTPTQQTDSGLDQDEVLTGERTVVLAARGLSCPLCASNVDRVMKAVDGVSTVQTDLERGHVIVGLEEDHSVTRRQLIRAIEDAGFTFTEFVTAGA